MKLRSLKTLAASAAALSILIVGLGGYSPSRAGILDFCSARTRRQPRPIQRGRPPRVSTRIRHRCWLRGKHRNYGPSFSNQARRWSA